MFDRNGLITILGIKSEFCLGEQFTPAQYGQTIRRLQTRSKTYGFIAKTYIWIPF